MINNIVLFIFLNLFISYTSYAQESFPLLKKLEKNGVQVSAMIVRLKDKQVLSELNPKKVLIPASTSKLILAADALETWGPNKIFNSKFYARGSIKQGVLQGDLIFYGEGDPYLTNEKLWFLTTDVARRGIKKITGKVIINNSFFGDIKEDQNRIAGRYKSHNAYDSPISSAAVNFSVLAIVVNPNNDLGMAANLSIEPYNLPSVHIINNVKTVAKNIVSQIQVTRISNNKQDTYTVSGTISINSPSIRVYRSVSDPCRYAAEVLNAFLNHAGISTSANISVEKTKLLNSDKLLASVDGFPLAWQLRGLFATSNNFIADTLLMDLYTYNKAKDPNKNISIFDAGKNLQDYMKKVIIEYNPKLVKNLNDFSINSGSGLTPETKLSSQNLISVLGRLYFNAKDFPAYLSALPIPGDDGTLRRRFFSSSQIHLQKSLRAKTGTLTQPVNVVSLAGYSRLRNGDWVAFAVLLNSSKEKTSFGIENLRNILDASLAEALPPEL